MQIQLSWVDPDTGDRQEIVLETPVALGREFAQMPDEIHGNRVSRIVLADSQVAEYHALLDVSNNELIAVDRNTSTGTLINGVRLPSSTIIEGDRLQIGPYEIQVNLNIRATAPSSLGETWTCDRMVGFLFPRRCGRTSRIGCEYCNSGSVNDPYFYERSYYSGYGRYDRGNWGSDYYEERDRYSYNSETGDVDFASTGSVDFTDADNISLETEADTDFEHDMGAS